MHSVRQRGLAIALALLAVALIGAATTQHELYRYLFADRLAFALTIAVVMLACSLLTWLTTFDRGRSLATIRMDWFVPALKKLQPHQSPSHSLVGRWLRKLVPARLQSNHATKKRGLFRKVLRSLGISWLASPVRRVVQGVTLVVFLVLFFFVCWPYSAQPAAPGKVSLGWASEAVDQQSGEFVLSRDLPATNTESDWSVTSGDTVAVVDESTSEGTSNSSGSRAVGTFIVVQGDPLQVRLAPRQEITSQWLDSFLGGTSSYSLHQRDPTEWPQHYADNLARKEIIPAETFLILDPLVSLSTAIASRSWVWSLVSAAAILFVCVLIPRGFCGYLCPLGTTIDLFDWAIAGRTKKLRVAEDGWWVHIKYYLLAGTLVAAICGVLVSGFFSAIPVITRAMLFLVEPLQHGLTRGWRLNPSVGIGHVVSILMFASVLCLGFLRPRFWCKYVCPSGAVFSLGNLFRLTERKVESSCIHCNKCVEICPFDAIKPDFTTRTTDCTMCQSCGGVCPTHAIKFVERWNIVELKIKDDPPTKETALGRRGFLSLAAGSTAAAVGGIGLAGVTKVGGANLADPNAFRPVRPPGSVPEKDFLEICIRCGECFKVCPNNVLQPEGFQQGLEGLWTPMVEANWAGCDSSCNACGQVCPTGAIRALPIEEKKVARMGLAIVNESTCLPFAGLQACDLCVQECNAAGYRAIEFSQVGTEIDSDGLPIEGTGYLAPVVLDDLCVGCGLCQTRCFAINVKEERLISESAIIVKAGDDREDRLNSGSYIELRRVERSNLTPVETVVTPTIDSTDDPFGINSSSSNTGDHPGF